MKSNRLLPLTLLGLAACASRSAPATEQPRTASRTESNTGASQAKEAASTSAVQPAWGVDPKDRGRGPLLFEARLPAGTLHLFGTMHTEPLTSMPRVASERFADARRLAFEVDVARIEPALLLKFARLPEGESLPTLIGDEAWRRVEKCLEGLMPSSVLAGYRPWFAAATMMQKLSGIGPGSELMDVALLQRSRADGKDLRFLETPEEQFTFLDQSLDAPVLVALTKQLEEMPKFFAAMTESYRAGDVAALERMLEDNERWGMTDEQIKVLLGARNERWVPFLEKLALEGGGFVAVGAGHLVGDDGLVALLRARGYPVVRVLEHSTGEAETPRSSRAQSNGAPAEERFRPAGALAGLEIITFSSGSRRVRQQRHRGPCPAFETEVDHANSVQPRSHVVDAAHREARRYGQRRIAKRNAQAGVADTLAFRDADFAAERA